MADEMTYQDTYARVVDIIAQKLQINQSEITPESGLADLGADSLDIVDIIMNIEEKFGVSIDDAKAEQLHTVADVVAYVDTLRTKK